MNKVNFLIVSDLHSTVEEELKDSKLIFHPKTQTSEHANAFINYVKELGKDIDYLVCPGDISNKGDVDGFKAGWSFLHELKDQVGASNLLCVPGNHDHQSRPGEQFSVIHELKFIQPSFPTNCHQSNTMFWGWHWMHQEFDKFNLIKLNSSAYHGINDEYKHGRVAVETSDQIHDYLKSQQFEEKEFNILLCHHHPIPMDDVDETFDYEVMEGGQHLLKKLDEANVGPWLVVHGHKHFASVSHGMTQRSTPPVIFSAGSLGASLYPQIEDRTANQFYILTVDLDKTSHEGCLVGTFEAYSWNLMNGWHPSQCNHLPHKGGFGAPKKPHALIRELKELLTKGTYLDKTDLASVQSEIDYYTPGQFKELLEKMDKLSIQFEYQGNEILEVASNE
ncbi:metallophosphoesterase family protein [Vibrio splendidus]|uniref:Metallophosphoesterase n=1 Tax=Vibrio splendidus TaxID=29497 RepID=A0A7Y4D6Y2_VIBSP|nr:metallophosphoesterase [Vibrio splendidus]NOJ12926.1 metallophosphoesterase [Vibrio splendidus]